MLERFEDLRFSIGAFFLIVGLLLVAAGLVVEGSVVDGTNVNVMTGVGFFVFGLIPLSMALFGKKIVQ